MSCKAMTSSILYILALTTSVMAQQPSIEAQGDDIYVTTSGSRRKLTEMTAGGGAASIDTIPPNYAVIGTMTLADTARLSFSFSGCSSFTAVVTGNPNSRMVDVFVVAPDSTANFGEQNGIQFFYRVNGQRVILGMSPEDSCSGPISYTYTSNLMSFSTDSSSSNNLSPITSLRLAASQTYVDSIVSALSSQMNNLAATVAAMNITLESANTSLPQLVNDVSNLQDLYGVLNYDVNLIASNITGINSCATQGGIHQGDGTCISTIPTCPAISIQNGFARHGTLGSMINEAAPFGTVAQISCSSGYGADTSVSICGDSGWSPAVPQSCFSCPSGCTRCSSSNVCLECDTARNFYLRSDGSCGQCGGALGSTNLLRGRAPQTSTNCYLQNPCRPEFLTDGVQRGLSNADRNYWHSCRRGGVRETATVSTLAPNGAAQCVTGAKIWHRCNCCTNVRVGLGVQALDQNGSWVQCSFGTTYNAAGPFAINGPDLGCEPYTFMCPGGTIATSIRMIGPNAQYITVAEFEAFGMN